MCMKTIVQMRHLHVSGPLKLPLTPCHHQVIYCFNYRQKEYQKEFITTLIGMTPAGPPQGQRGSPSLFSKISSGSGNLKWMQSFRALSLRCVKRHVILNTYALLYLNDKLIQFIRPNDWDMKEDKDVWTPL